MGITKEGPNGKAADTGPGELTNISHNKTNKQNKTNQFKTKQYKTKSNKQNKQTKQNKSIQNKTIQNKIKPTNKQTNKQTNNTNNTKQKKWDLFLKDVLKPQDASRMTWWLLLEGLGDPYYYEYTWVAAKTLGETSGFHKSITNCLGPYQRTPK